MNFTIRIVLVSAVRLLLVPPQKAAADTVKAQ